MARKIEIFIGDPVKKKDNSTLGLVPKSSKKNLKHYWQNVCDPVDTYTHVNKADCCSLLT